MAEIAPWANWAWQTQIEGAHGNVLPVSVFSTAASSGFPSIATASSAAIDVSHFSNSCALQYPTM